MDGISIKNVLENPNDEFNRESIFWHYPLENPHFLGGTSSGAIRSGDWKLIEFFDDQRLELYNLKYDRSESLDVANFTQLKPRNYLSFYKNGGQMSTLKIQIKCSIKLTMIYL